jgi:hypothetical protein
MWYGTTMKLLSTSSAFRPWFRSSVVIAFRIQKYYNYTVRYEIRLLAFEFLKRSIRYILTQTCRISRTTCHTQLSLALGPLKQFQDLGICLTTSYCFLLFSNTEKIQYTVLYGIDIRLWFLNSMNSHHSRGSLYASQITLSSQQRIHEKGLLCESKAFIPSFH